MIAGNFLDLLKQEHSPFASAPNLLHTTSASPQTAMSSATTILAFKYREGLLIAGDRRATAGNMVMFDRADKVIDIDRYSVMAIAGSPATAFEMARVLSHSFQYYRRSQLQDLSLEGKVRALSRLLKENVPAAVQGIGTVVPIFVAYDPENGQKHIYFYDMLGAEFEVVDFATTGSGSPGIRGVLHFYNRWNPEPISALSQDDAVVLAMRLLETAAEHDSATGGIKTAAQVFPTVKTITEEGVRSLSLANLKSLYHEKVENRHV